MDFSIIVPSYNEEKRIRACLESIRAQRTRCSYEVIVSDSGSTDATVAIAREYTDKVVLGKEKGTARARNEGASIAQGDILAFIDSDTVLMPDYLDTVSGAFRNKNTLAISCAFKFTNRRPKLLMAEYVTNTYYFGRSLFHAATLPGFNVCIKKDTFTGIGGFRLCHLEDLDISMKLRKLGRTFYLPRRKVITSSRRLETDGVLNTLQYYMDLYEATQQKRLIFHIINIKKSQYDDYIHRE